MLIKKSFGFRVKLYPLCVCVWMSFTTSVLAWQQEYIVTDPQSNTPERYTWDSDHQPRYDDILAERISASQPEPGMAMNVPDETPVDANRTLSVGWNIPVSHQFSTGPVASWHYDGSATSMWNEFGDSGTSTTALTDPMWHASISTLGWRFDSQPLWGVHPWAQISYNQQFGENQWKSQSGLNRTPTSTQDGNWMDVTVGADMLLNEHVAAYASLSQADNMSEGANYLYIMGVSARF
jgi:Autotransporter protein or domain, integral membrane beta-barrel involved in protein secretion